MSAFTFLHALEQAELLARQTLPPALHERLSCGVALVKDGHVFQTSDGTWQVTSTSTAGRQYTVNGSCPCDDAYYNKPPQGLCKHRLAVYLARKASALMQAPVPVVPEAVPEPYPDNDPGPEPPPCPAPLPEAPASANCHVLIEGRQIQLTLRDTDEVRLLARLAAVLKQYPAPPAPTKGKAQPQGERSWCAIHNVAMKETTKDGRSWWSHKTDQGWCKGR